MIHKVKKEFEVRKMEILMRLYYLEFIYVFIYITTITWIIILLVWLVGLFGALKIKAASSKSFEIFFDIYYDNIVSTACSFQILTMFV